MRPVAVAAALVDSCAKLLDVRAVWTAVQQHPVAVGANQLQIREPGALARPELGRRCFWLPFEQHSSRE